MGEMDGRCVTESTMMKMVRLGMDRAQEKVMSKHGVLGRLMEISKFYELAVMQLEGCLRFVQEEANLEEHVLDDLSEIRDRLQGRLLDTERTIMAKDRERADLKLALRIKDRELLCLRAKLQDEGQLVPQPEPEPEPELLFLDGALDNTKVEQMGSDIHILKDTFNLAFGNLHSAIILSAMEPSEQQWRRSVEESVFSTTVRGLVTDLQHTIGDEVRKMEYQVSTALSDHLSNLMTQMTSLRTDLDSLTAVTEDQSRKIPPKLPQLSSKLSEPHLHNEACREEDGGNFVAKLVKSHESFIRRKSQDLNWLKIDAPHEKEGQPLRRHRGADDLKTRIQHVISRLDNLISWNAKMGETLLTSPNVTERDKSGHDTMEDVWEKIQRGSVLPRVTTSAELQDEITRLKQENQDMDIQNKVMEEVLGTLLTSLENEFDLVIQGAREALYGEMVSKLKEEFESNKIESLITGDVNCIVFAEAMENYEHYTQGITNVHEVFLRETINEWEMEIDAYNELIHGKEQFWVLEATVKEDVCKIFLRETVNEWKMEMEMEEIHQFVVGNALEDVGDDKVVEIEEDVMATGAGSEIKDLVFMPLVGVMEDFQCMIDRKIGCNMSRLEEGRRCIHSLGEHALTLRKSAALYKDAFIRRCHNLHKAEAEVDLLGDQVHQLFDLLNKIYKILQHYSPLLQQYSEVSDMVRLIKKVLVAGL